MPVSKILRNRQPINGNWCIACNPITGQYTDPIHTEAHQTTDTGLPVVVFGPTADVVCAMLFSAYELDEDNNLVSYTQREVTVSVQYGSEAAADANAQAARDELPTVLTRPIKHPDRNEYALFWSDYVFDNHGRNGPNRAAIASAHAAKVSNGHSKSIAAAVADGWR